MKNLIIKNLTVIVFCLSITTQIVSADNTTQEKKSVKLGGFVDAFYAYDFNKPTNRDRDFTTQSIRNNEFNINLAFIDAKLESEQLRGRLALQAGTSVQSNYAGEPTTGLVSGPILSRHIQEAYGGYQIQPGWWMDAGIMLSHIGMESWISRDNPVYLRSLVADYSPFYQTGIRNDFKFNDQWSAQLLVLNGWQNISENNSSKSIGTQITYTANDSLSLSYNTLIGNEARFRHFHDFIMKTKISTSYSLWFQGDYGSQSHSGDWNGFALINQFNLSQKLSLSVRGERYSDPNQVIVVTGGNAFKAWGASLGADYKPVDAILYRFEARSLFANKSVFQSKSGLKQNQTVLVLSMGLSL